MTDTDLKGHREPEHSGDIGLIVSVVAGHGPPEQRGDSGVGAEEDTIAEAESTGTLSLEAESTTAELGTAAELDSTGTLSLEVESTIAEFGTTAELDSTGTLSLEVESTTAEFGTTAELDSTTLGTSVQEETAGVCVSAGISEEKGSELSPGMQAVSVHTTVEVSGVNSTTDVETMSKAVVGAIGVGFVVEGRTPVEMNVTADVDNIDITELNSSRGQTVVVTTTAVPLVMVTTRVVYWGAPGVSRVDINVTLLPGMVTPGSVTPGTVVPGTVSPGMISAGPVIAGSVTAVSEMIVETVGEGAIASVVSCSMHSE